MNRIESITDSLTESASQYLGLLAWFSLPDIRISESELNSLASQHGLSAPSLGAEADAFRRATSSHQHRHEGTKARFLVRPVTDDPAQIHRQIVVERVVNDHGNTLRHLPLVDLTYDKATGTATFAATEAVNTVPTEIHHYAIELAESAMASFREFLQSFTGRQMVRFVMAELAKLQFIPAHPRGGVYFVPRSGMDQAKRIRDFARSLSGYTVNKEDQTVFCLTPVVDTTEQRDQIAGAASAAIFTEIEQGFADIEKYMAADSTTRLSTAEKQLEAVADIRIKAQSYATLCGSTLDEVMRRIQILDKQAETLYATVTADAASKARKQRRRAG